MPCPALPCPALPCPALPCPALLAKQAAGRVAPAWPAAMESAAVLSTAIVTLVGACWVDTRRQSHQAVTQAAAEERAPSSPRKERVSAARSGSLGSQGVRCSEPPSQPMRYQRSCQRAQATKAQLPASVPLPSVAMKISSGTPPPQRGKLCQACRWAEGAREGRSVLRDLLR